MKLFFQHGSRMKAIECPNVNEENLKKMFEDIFQTHRPPGTSLIISAFDEDAADFVEVDNFDAVTPNTKLKFQYIGNGNDEEVLEQETPAVDPRLRRESYGGKFIPVSYTLPDFGFPLNMELDKKKPLSLHHRSLLNKKLFKDMLSYCKDLVPSSTEIQRVVDALLRKYPFLQDKPVLKKKNSKTTKDISVPWKVSLQRKFRFAREKNLRNPKYPHLKDLQKYSNNRHRRESDENSLPDDMTPQMQQASHSATPEGASRVLQRRKQSSNDEVPPNRYDDGEDERTTATHQQILKEEWKKDLPNLNVVQARMLCTASIRWFQLRELSLHAIQEMYPNLTNYHQWMEEFERVKRKSLAEVREAFLTQQRLLLLKEQISRRRDGSSRVAAFGAANPSNLTTAVLGCFPLLCSEKVEKWILINQDCQDANPVLIATTKTGGDYFFHEAMWVPYIDGQKLVHEETLHLEEAIDVLIAAIHLMNVKYPMYLKKTWTLLSQIVYELDGEEEPTATEMALASVICQDP